MRHARAWMDGYVTAERRGRDSLRRFLLDLDAKEANDAEARTLGEVIALYLAVNAHPRNEGGLAPSTYERYESTANCHLLGRPRRDTLAPAPYALAVAVVPAAHFNGPQAPRAWREQMVREGASKAAREQAWRVLSAALSWAAASHLVPEIEVNGCGLRPNRVATSDARCAAEAPATPRQTAVADHSWPAGRSPRRPWRRSARRCSRGSRAGARSSRTATRWS